MHADDATAAHMAASDPRSVLSLLDSLSDLRSLRDELYEFRLLYHALLFNEWARTGEVEVCKSSKHDTGETCGDGHLFIVVAHLPGIGQISNHYRREHWDMFAIPQRDVAPAFDGHTSADVRERLAAYLRR